MLQGPPAWCPGALYVSCDGVRAIEAQLGDSVKTVGVEWDVWQWHAASVAWQGSAAALHGAVAVYGQWVKPSVVAVPKVDLSVALRRRA